MNKNLVWIVIFILLISLGILLFVKNKTNIFGQQSNGRSQPVFVKIKDLELEVEIAETLEKKALGLSGRKQILDNQGILFVFKSPGRYPFWTKGMNFPIDIIWLDENLEIAEINKNIQPASFPKILRPSKPSQYVLEVKAGWTDENNIRQGDKCSLINY